MTRFWKTGLTLFLSLAAMSCGATSGFLRDSMTQTQVRGPGFRIVKTGLSASSDTGAVFCTIPTDEGEVYRRAMEQLNGQAKLMPNQMLVNIREDLRITAYLFFYCKQRLTLSADIIEFTGAGAPFAPMPPPLADAPRGPVTLPPTAAPAPAPIPAPALAPAPAPTPGHTPTR
jgi:hypothetical protein